MTNETKQADEQEPSISAATEESAAQEQAAPQEAEAPATAEAEELVLRLEDARAKADEHWSMYLRANAELDNMRKRFDRDLENAHKFGIEKHITHIFPVQFVIDEAVELCSGHPISVQ